MGNRSGWQKKKGETKWNDGKTVSNEILKGQVRAVKSGRPSQKTEGDGDS